MGPGIEVAGLLTGPEAAKDSEVGKKWGAAWVLLAVVREGLTAGMNNKRRKGILHWGFCVETT